MGQVYYTPWCDEHGKVIDDGTVHRVDEHELRWTAADPQYRWLTQNAAGLDVTVEDVTEELAALALQGPFSRAVLEAATGEYFADLRYFRRREATIAGTRIDVSRTGYTGDLGYELWIPRRRRRGRLGRRCSTSAGRTRIRPAGMVALDVSRLEAGLILLEVDYTSARHAMNPEQNYSPFEIGLGRLVSFDKADFVGPPRAPRASRRPAGRRGASSGSSSTGTTSRACTTPRACRPRSRATRRPLPGPGLRRRSKQVGKATSHGWSPILKQAIALASVPPRYERGRDEARGRVDGRGPARAGSRATVVELPFLDLDRKRA